MKAKISKFLIVQILRFKLKSLLKPPVKILKARPKAVGFIRGCTGPSFLILDL